MSVLIFYFCLVFFHISESCLIKKKKKKKKKKINDVYNLIVHCRVDVIQAIITKKVQANQK